MLYFSESCYCSLCAGWNLRPFNPEFFSQGRNSHFLGCDSHVCWLSPSFFWVECRFFSPKAILCRLNPKFFWLITVNFIYIYLYKSLCLTLDLSPPMPQVQSPKSSRKPEPVTPKQRKQVPVGSLQMGHGYTISQWG